ncbi:SprB repeat-containing protein [Hymenobacter sp. PAMC 26628]|uniref:SprB repeat-containing protein n=1 Tax=Hymenobacter sp. PAMC 26628 TaxID=1484118 RepID=UPI0007700129|nr:SprB repeat-containing protein [Hymenobacter sp. PAMC 26628]AMJ65054.1 hypothetical protein AXW84_06135 [Hymenobacter sp. PAMC 26628]
MAGERYAKLTVRLELSLDPDVRGRQTKEVRFRLGGNFYSYYQGDGRGPNQFIVVAPEDFTADGRAKFVRSCVDNLLALVRATVALQGLAYAVPPPRAGLPDPVNDVVPVEFDLIATSYAPVNDLVFEFPADAPAGTWTILQNLDAVQPIQVGVNAQPATVYGSATGSIYLTPYYLLLGGDFGTYSYQWADQPLGVAGSATRTGLVGPRTYTVTVTDTNGASTTVNVDLGSDPRLVVLVQKDGADVALVVSGGVPGYTYAWADGASTAARPGLANGTYSCTVTDQRGATVTVRVVVDLSGRFYFSRNPVTLELADPDFATKPNLAFLCEVWVEEVYLSGTFTSIAGVLTQPADAQGKTTFDVSTLLDAYVGPDFPAHGETGVRLAGQAFKRFYLQHSAQWDGVPPPAYVQRETYYLVYGGLDFFEYAAGSYFSRYRPQVRPFLSWEPVQKEVFADQPEYLYYHHDSDAAFGMQVRFTTATGTTSTVALGPAQAAARYSVWCAGVGLAQLRAVLGPAVPADAVAWEVTAVNAAQVAVSETRYYQLRDEPTPYRRYFLYANSVGGVNTLACYGKAKKEVDFANVLVQRSLQPNYRADDGETFTTSATGVPVLRANTGYLSPAQMDALHDFLLSEEIRYYDADRYRPGSLQPATTVPMEDDDEGLLSLELSFVLPTLRRYTPALPLS